MAQAPFAAAVAALWAELGLPAPVPGRDGYDLSVDGQALRVSPTPDGRSALVSARLGRLAADPVRAAEQVRRILRDGTGLVLSCAAAVRLEPGVRDGDAGSVVAEAVAPCGPRGATRLRSAIEDALFLADVHRPALSGPSAARAAPPPIPAADEIIFRL